MAFERKEESIHDNVETPREGKRIHKPVYFEKFFNITKPQMATQNNRNELVSTYILSNI